MAEQVIVKITEYYGNPRFEEPVSWVSEKCPAWVRANHVPEFLPHYDVDDEQTILAPGISPEDAEDMGEDWDTMFQLITSDNYEIIPDDEVPEEVWAEIAKRALLGEVNND